MVDVLVKHAFVSTKPDSSDSSMVSSSEWNAAEVFSGGTHGQLVARDGGAATGASYIARPNVTGVGGSHSGASPTAVLCTTVVVATTAVFTCITATVSTITSGGAGVTVTVYEDGVAQMTLRASGAGFSSSGTINLARSPGSKTYTLQATADSGTFTSFVATLVTLTVGVV